MIMIDEASLSIPINEVYFGKTPEMITIQNQLSIIRQKYMNKYITSSKVNTDKELIKLNRMFEDCFGFGCFMLNIINSREVNAFTTPISSRYDVPLDGSSLIVSKTGYKFKKELDYSIIVNIYAGLIFNDNFSDEEVMACILHEIGHNFSANINSTMGVLTSLFNIIRMVIQCGTVVGILVAAVNTNSFNKSIDKFVRRLKEDNSFILVIPAFFNTISSLISAGLHNISDIINVLTLGIAGNYTAALSVLKKFKNPYTLAVNLLLMPKRYTDERIADNFATMYGYGGASVTLQEKFSTQAPDYNSIMNGVNKIPLISTLIHANMLPSTIALSLFDEHPTGLVRAKDQLDLLKYEASKTDLDPKMKRCILSDIKACEKQLEKLTDTSGGIEDPYLAKKIYFLILSKLTDSKQIKDMLFDGSAEKRFNAYDRRYKENI